MNRFTYYLDNLDVVRFRGSQGGPDEEIVRWSVGYAPDAAEAHDGLWVRIVIATLHAAGPGGWAEIDAGAFLVTHDEPAEDELEDKIRVSSAVEALYDFACTHIRGMLAVVGARVELPEASPEPVMSVLIPRDDPDADIYEETAN